MTASHFVSVTEEVMNAIKKSQFRRAQKMLLILELHFLKERYEILADWIKWTYQIQVKLVLYLDTSNQNNWNRKDSTKWIFTTEFESTELLH